MNKEKRELNEIRDADELNHDISTTNTELGTDREIDQEA